MIVDEILSFWRSKHWAFDIRNMDQGAWCNYVRIAVLESPHLSKYESKVFYGSSLLESMQKAHEWAVSVAYNGKEDPHLNLWITSEKEDLLSLDKEFLVKEIVHLRNAIREHRDQKGHDRCWMDDDDLYCSLPERESAIDQLPPKDEWLENCKTYCDHYWENRQRMYPPKDKT